LPVALVSHTAPYHHFADRAALIAALVETGFTQLSQAMQTASAAHQGDLGRLRATGVAYVQFAVAQPALFRLLCRPELRSSDAAGFASEAGRDAYAVLVDAVQACLASGEVQGDLNRCYHLVRRRINDGVRAAGFVRDVQLAEVRIIGDPVGVLAARDRRNCRQALRVDHCYLIGASG
jgi:AcrR family transcriptional regulator